MDELICHARTCFGFCRIDGDSATCPDCGAQHVRVEGVWRKVSDKKRGCLVTQDSPVTFTFGTGTEEQRRRLQEQVDAIKAKRARKEEKRLD